MKSQSFICHSVKELRDHFASNRSAGFHPTLGIVFASPKHSFDSLIQLFDDAKIDLVGCSTAGEVCNGDLEEESIVVLLMEIDPSYYTIQFDQYKLEEVYQKSFQLGTSAKASFENPGIILLSSGIKADALKLMGGLKDGLGKEVPLYGGLAADDLEMTQTFTFSNKFISDHGIIVLAIDMDKIIMQGLATSGWQPLGGVNTITGANGNVVYSINNEPALDVFMRHFGFDEQPETKKEQLLSIQTNYPLQLIKNNLDSVLRSPLVIDQETKSLILAAGVETGDQFRFSNSPGFEVIEQTVEEFHQLKVTSPEADAILLFSCKGRHGAFGPVLEEEIEGIYNYWNKPMIGFLSYGEFGNTKNGICEFHNETCSLVILKER